jgi:hypothetical protein
MSAVNLMLLQSTPYTVTGWGNYRYLLDVAPAVLHSLIARVSLQMQMWKGESQPR